MRAPVPNVNNPMITEAVFCWSCSKIPVNPIVADPDMADITIEGIDR
jgi:hypothetical protein